jgi:hypothetical protein
MSNQLSIGAINCGLTIRLRMKRNGPNGPKEGQ